MTDATRKEQRPVNPELTQDKYWVPKLQQWMSLTEIEYERIRAKVRSTPNEEEEEGDKS